MRELIDRELMKQINKERSKKPPFAFWGMMISVVSLLYGEFIWRVDGFFLNHAEPYMQKLPENFIGIFLIFGAVIKLIGVFTEIKICKRWGIWLLGGAWSGLFVVTTAFSFGTGYPHPSWIFALMLMVSSFRIAFKGDFY